MMAAARNHRRPPMKTGRIEPTSAGAPMMAGAPAVLTTGHSCPLLCALMAEPRDSGGVPVIRHRYSVRIPDLRVFSCNIRSSRHRRYCSDLAGFGSS